MHNFTPFLSRKPTDTRNDEMLWLRGKLLIDCSTWNCHCDPCSTALHPHQEHLPGTCKGLLRRTSTYAEVHAAPTVQTAMLTQRPACFIIDSSMHVSVTRRGESKVWACRYFILCWSSTCNCKSIQKPTVLLSQIEDDSKTRTQAFFMAS